MIETLTPLGVGSEYNWMRSGCRAGHLRVMGKLLSSAIAVLFCGLVDLPIVAVLAASRRAALSGGGQPPGRPSAYTRGLAASAGGGILRARRVAVVVGNAGRRRGRRALRLRAVVRGVAVMAMMAAATAQHEAGGNDW